MSKAYQRDKLLLSFLDSDCRMLPESVEDANEGIEEIQFFIRLSIEKNDKEEVKNWRRLLQQARAEKIEVKEACYT